MERRLRLRAEADFARIRSQGRSLGERRLTLLILPNGLEHNRYGIVVSKRVGKAVTRNVVKRRLREVLRRLDRDGAIPPGLDLALIVRPVAATATFAELREGVTALLQRAGVWRAVPAAPPPAPEAPPPPVRTERR